MLLKINELQTHDPKQFEELGLTLAIKRLAWETDTKTFVRIASPHAELYLASEFSPKMVLSAQQVGILSVVDVPSRWSKVFVRATVFDILGVGVAQFERTLQPLN